MSKYLRNDSSSFKQREYDIAVQKIYKRKRFTNKEE